MKRRLIAIALILCLVLSMFPVTAFAATMPSGKCGKNVTWSFDTSTRTLSISGSGAMYDYDDAAWEGAAPYFNYHEQIRKVVITPEITYIGAYAFGTEFASSVYGYPNLNEISFTPGGNLTELGDYAFYGLDALESITLPANLTTLGLGSLPTSLKEILVERGNTVFSSTDGVLFQGSTLLQYPGKKSSISYTVPSGTTAISVGAFTGASNLADIKIPSSVESLNCVLPENVKSVALNEGLKSISSKVFLNCHDLERVEIPASVTELTYDGWTASEEAYLGDRPSLSLYFKGNAPSMDGQFFSTYDYRDLTVYYPENATGWDAVQAQADIEAAVSAGNLEFKTWKPTGTETIVQKSGKFSYQDGKIDRQYEYTYSDSYFSTPSIVKGAGVYNHELAVMSLNLALAAFNSSDVYTSCTVTGSDYNYTDSIAGKNIEELLKDLEFGNIDISSYEGKPRTDSIAYALGSKRINCNNTDYTLIAVAVRGSGYEAEWGGNVRVGSKGKHTGFRIAADLVIGGLKKYIKEKEITGNVKLWITGYSRSAAVANLTAAAIDDGALNEIKGITLRGENLYAYTFESPKGTTSNNASAAIYQNIFNIVNPIDIVPKVAPKGWSFTRYGTDYYIPSGSTSSKAYSKVLMDAMKEYTRIKKGGDYTGNIQGFRMLTNQSVILDDFLSVLSFKCSRTKYALIYQDDLIPIVAEASDEEDLLVALKKIFTNYPLETIKLLNALSNLLGPNFYMLLGDMVVEGVLPSTDPGATATETLSQLFSIIFQPHYPTVTLAWMNTLEGVNDFGGSSYRKLTIACPVDVFVYSGKQLVAQIIDDEPVLVDGSLISAYVDGQGQKIVILPPDANYEVKVEATGDGSMSYTVEEYSLAAADVIKSVSYDNIRISNGDVLNGVVENLELGQAAQYPLYANNSAVPLTPGDQSNIGSFLGFLPDMMAGAANALEEGFVDVSRGAYYYNAVQWAAERGIAGGVDAKHFAPDASCTRAQAVTMLYRAAGCPETTAENPFEDVSVNDYYYEAVLWAVANGITSGTDAAHFSPNAPCTRGQIVTFLHRAARCIEAHESFGFTDVKAGSYCEDAINWAVENGITNGTDIATFSPDAVCTRAQIVTFLYRNR